MVRVIRLLEVWRTLVPKRTFSSLWQASSLIWLWVRPTKKRFKRVPIVRSNVFNNPVALFPRSRVLILRHLLFDDTHTERERIQSKCKRKQWKEKERVSDDSTMWQRLLRRPMETSTRTPTSSTITAPSASSSSTSTIRQTHKRTFSESDSSSRTERHLCSFSHLWIIKWVTFLRSPVRRDACCYFVSSYLSSYLDDPNSTCLQSESFSPVNTPYSNTRWSLKLYPRGLNEKQHTNNNLAIFLKYISGTMPTIKAKAEFSVVSRNNELVMLRSTNFHTFSSGNDWGYSGRSDVRSGRAIAVCSWRISRRKLFEFASKWSVDRWSSSCLCPRDPRRWERKSDEWCSSTFFGDSPIFTCQLWSTGKHRNEDSSVDISFVVVDFVFSDEHASLELDHSSLWFVLEWKRPLQVVRITLESIEKSSRWRTFYRCTYSCDSQTVFVDEHCRWTEEISSYQT